MATPPAPPAPTDPPTVHLPSQPAAQPAAEAPQTGHGPAPAAAASPVPVPAAPGSLAQMLTPIAPARPVPIGSTATLGQAPQPGAEGAAPGDATSKDGKDDAANAEGPLSALVRALASRWGRTGTATTIKRNHEVKETRVSGSSVNTTNANKSDRTAKSENSSQRRSTQDAKSNRDAKVADLNNKTSAQHGKTSSDSKKADTRDAKTSSDAKRGDTRDAKTSAATSDTKAAKADTSSKSAKDAKTSAATSDTKAAKADTSSKSAKDDRTSADTKAAKNSDSKSSKASGGSAGTEKAGSSGSGGSKSGKEPEPGRAGKIEAKFGSDSAKNSAPDQAGDKPAKAPKPDGVARQAGAGASAAKPGQAGTGAKGQSPKEETKGGQGKAADLAKKPEAVPGANASTTEPVSKPEQTERPRTQFAREAGYRDGRRAAGAVGQAQAYRDGVKDGWLDQQATDSAERKKMDEAKIRNAQRPKEPPKPPMAPIAGSTAGMAEKDPANKPIGQAEAASAVPPKPTHAPTVPAGPKADPAQPKKPGVDLAKAPKPGEESKAAPTVPPKPTSPPTVPAQAKADPARPKGDDGPDTGAATKPTGPERPPGRSDGKTVDHGPFRPGPVASTTALAQAAPPEKAAADAVTGAIQLTPHTAPDIPAPQRRSHETMPDPSTTTPVWHKSQVTVTPSTVSFPADGGTREMGRTEIRTLKGFENTMHKQGADLAKIAEEGKAAVTLATQHALTAQKLHERAKTVKGGEALIRELDRLTHSCRELCKAAEKTERRAAKGAEAAAALVVNADARHGAIYEAVVDSDLTSAAEKEFYRDQQGG